MDAVARGANPELARLSGFGEVGCL
jgi:hypothetical protein